MVIEYKIVFTAMATRSLRNVLVDEWPQIKSTAVAPGKEIRSEPSPTALANGPREKASGKRRPCATNMTNVHTTETNAMTNDD
jgi:hypothetical protein